MAYQLDLRDLRYFETIAELGHLGQAAKRVHRTQPALTSCVRRLEAAFGTPLFERVGRGIRLTPAGALLLARAKRLRLAADETTREMEEVARGVTGLIRLGVVPTAAQHLLPAACRSFLADAPGVTLKTVIGQGDVLTAELKAGELDLIVAFDAKADDDFVAHDIFHDVAVVAAARSHEIHRKRVGMKDLLAYRWVLAAPTAETRQWLDQAFDVHGLPRPTVQIETNLVLLLPPLIESSGLLSFISRRHLDPGRAGAPLKEVPLKETTMRRTFRLIYRKDGYLSPAARRLVSLLRAKGKVLFQAEL
jgi:DNA-binding transcriptional LysR family regulator